MSLHLPLQEEILESSLLEVGVTHHPVPGGADRRRPLNQRLSLSPVIHLGQMDGVRVLHGHDQAADDKKDTAVVGLPWQNSTKPELKNGASGLIPS